MASSGAHRVSRKKKRQEKLRRISLGLKGIKRKERTVGGKMARQVHYLPDSPKKKEEKPLKKRLSSLTYQLFESQKLGKRCKQPIRSIFRESGTIFGKVGAQHAFKDNGSDILAVAHCDVVTGLADHYYDIDLTDVRHVFSPRLDDRMGVYTILDFLPRLGINLDILLTQNEEIGQSTARDFKPVKQYKWIVEFDRAGDNVVTYMYGGWQSEWDKLIEEDFKDTSRGSVSDISYLKGLGCKGLNVGVGYQRHHTNLSYANVHVFTSQIARFMIFYNRHKETHFEHKEYVYNASRPHRTPASEAHGNATSAAHRGWLKRNWRSRENPVMRFEYICQSCKTPFDEEECFYSAYGASVTCPVCYSSHVTAFR